MITKEYSQLGSLVGARTGQLETSKILVAVGYQVINQEFRINSFVSKSNYLD